MENIRFYNVNKEEISKIKALWERLNQHHLLLTPHFREYYENFTFEERMAKFQNGDKTIHLMVAEDSRSKTMIGYCLTSLNPDQSGEVDSLYIEEAYRGLKIGETLLSDASKWLDNNHVKRKILSVAYGNEKAEQFYKKCGFYPAYTVFTTKKLIK